MMKTRKDGLKKWKEWHSNVLNKTKMGMLEKVFQQNSKNRTLKKEMYETLRLKFDQIK